MVFVSSDFVVAFEDNSIFFAEHTETFVFRSHPCSDCLNLKSYELETYKIKTMEKYI